MKATRADGSEWVGNPEIKRIAIFGAGWVARECYAMAMRHRKLRLVSIFDPNENAAEQLRNQLHDGTVCRTPEQLLETEPDLVVVATPNYLHVEQSESALKAGLNVLCEKPLSTTRAETLQLLACGGSRLFVSTPNRFRPDVKALFSLIKQGAIGRIYCVRLSWKRVAGLPRPGSWYTTRQCSFGGVLVDLGSHLLDIGLRILQVSSPMTVKACLSSPFSADPHRHRSVWMDPGDSDQGAGIDVETRASVLVSFASGEILEVDASWAGYGDEDRTIIEAEGDDGRIILSTLFGYSSCHVTPPTLTLWQKNEKKVSEFSFVRCSQDDFGEMLDSILVPGVLLKPGTGEQWLRIVEVLEKSYGTAVAASGNECGQHMDDHLVQTMA